MKINQAGLDIIKKFEGFFPTPYLCPVGIWTIGYGHTSGVNEHTPAITQEEAEELLARDVRQAEEVVRQFVRGRLNENQFSALVSFVFNVGRGNFIKSTLLKRLNESDYIGAGAEMLRWIYANGKIYEGLKKRRAAERWLFVEKDSTPGVYTV